MRFKYRPDHPEADEFGCVPAHLAYDYTPSPAPGVISDTMPETRHMADNKMYTSKHQFRQATKAAGCIEVGSETSYLLKPRKVVPLDRGARREAIKRALYEHKNGYHKR